MPLKIALPNKGSLSQTASQIFIDAGYRQRSDLKDLVFLDPNNDVEFYYLRPRDIAIYVGKGDLDAGITGRDLLLDSESEAKEILALDFGNSTFRFAGPKIAGSYDISALANRNIATAYPRLLTKYLSEKNIDANVVGLDGAVESSVALGVADFIADVVSTGGTLRAAGLTPFGDPILKSEAILIARNSQQITQSLDKLIHRLTGVIIARQYVLVDYDIETSKLAEAIKITPGFESPTVSPLAKSGWSAVRSMVKQREINQLMDQLWEIGARGILVTDIHACRL
jgi:ATP phosphoribosyltransferase